MSERTLTILGLAGSLRKASLNRALLAAAREVAPPGVAIEPFDLRGIPLYDADEDRDGGPEPVRALKRAIAAADGLLWVTPEYNYGIPGVLKNAIDWASRPAYRSVLAHKPSAIVGAAGSIVGTARAQGQLKQVLLGCLAVVHPWPEFLVAGAPQRFDATGALTDDETRRRLGEALADFARFAGGLRDLRESGRWPLAPA